MAALTLVLAGAAWGDSPVVLVTIDTLRADHLSAYGNPSVLTPHLDRLSRRSRTFADVRTVAPLTLPAHATMLTGLDPWEHGVRNNGQRLGAGGSTLAERFRERGMASGAFVSSYVLHRSFGLDRGFDVYDDVSGMGSAEVALRHPERPGAETVSRFESWVSARSGPFFAWVHLFEPHAPYVAPRPWEAGSYAGEVEAADTLVGRILRSLPDRTEVWVTSDHGEALGEHGEPTHGVFVYDSTLRVPLIGGRGAGEIEGTARSLIDLPVLIDGREEEPGPIRFESLSPWLDFGWSPLSGIVQDGWKLIHAPRPELYALGPDPGELADRSIAEEARRARMERALSVAPREGVGGAAPITEPERNALESLGYLGGGAGGREAARSPGADPKDMVDLLPLLGGVGGDLEAGIERVLAVDPENSLIRLRKAWLRLSQDRVSEAERIFAALATEGVLGSAPYYGRAACRSRQEDWPAAVRFFRRASDEDPSDLAIAANLGEVLLHIGRVSEAAAEFDRAVSDHDVGPQVAARLLAIRAEHPEWPISWRIEHEADPVRLQAIASAASRQGTDPSEVLQRARELQALDARGLRERASNAPPDEARALLRRATSLDPADAAALRSLLKLGLPPEEERAAEARLERLEAP